jgi:ABC-type nickel/cobalt efflux system permease component RcnA
LSLLRLTARYSAALPDGWRDTPPRVEFRDDNYSDRIGWREIIVRGGPGVDIAGSSAPDHDVSSELLAYPQNSLSSPLDVRNATFAFSPGVGSAPVPSPDATHLHATRGNPDGTLGRFTELVSREDMGIGFVLLALLAAMGFGAIHALSPGHGKTIVAAYLIGSRGTAKHALLLGLTVTATHTSSVYALGFITLYLSEYIVPETLYPWLSIASGGLILLMGMSLLVGRARSSGALDVAWRWLRGGRAQAAAGSLASERGAVIIATPSAPGIDHDDGNAPHTHNEGSPHVHSDDHDHGIDAGHRCTGHSDHGAAAHQHGWGPAHSHAIPGQDGEPVTWQRLVGLGIFGGLLPCPSAIVVMLSAIALHRVAFGLLLILFFSLGLAGVLTGIGFALVYSKAILRRLPFLQQIAGRADGGVGRVAVRAFPVLSAAAVVAAGLVITMRALSQQGWL